MLPVTDKFGVYFIFVLILILASNEDIAETLIILL